MHTHAKAGSFTTIDVDPPPDQRRRLADLAERTPVTLAIRVGTPITTTFQPDPTNWGQT
jgi:hypothetical protein